MPRYHRTLFVFGVLLLFIACTKDETVVLPAQEPAVIGYEGVDEELWIFFARFEEESRARGLEIDLREAGITGTIEELEEDGIAGQCNYASFRPNHVMIDRSFWDQVSDRLREFVVFHELGHCELGRDHREEAFSDGTCVSIMRSGFEDCRDNYRPETRAGYLDELFDPAFRDEIF